MAPLSTEEYKRPKQRDREVLTMADFTDADIAAIKKVKPSATASAFDHETKASVCVSTTFHNQPA